MALKSCQDTNELIHHSDRGVQYCCQEYVSLLKDNNIQISMTQNCQPNSLWLCYVPMTQFTHQLWQDITPIFNSILAHGFVDGLRTGRLSTPSFQYYIQQDALYLAEYARAVNQLAAKSNDPNTMLQFMQFAQDTIRIERALHDTYFTMYGIEAGTTKMPACFAYTNYLLATTAHQSIAVGIASLLPCYWIYPEVGKHIYKQALGQNPYQSWIDTYAGYVFEESVNEMLQLTETLAEQASPSERAAMQDAFRTSSRMEWYFWNDAYHHNNWLV